MIGFQFPRKRFQAGDCSRRAVLKSTIGGVTGTATGLLTAAVGGEAKRTSKRRCPTCTPLPIGSVCETTRQCCGTETNMACVLLSGDTVTTCRGTNGASCTGDTQCIDGFLCIQGRCRQVV